jgi:hypothetical protein
MRSPRTGDKKSEQTRQRCISESAFKRASAGLLNICKLETLCMAFLATIGVLLAARVSFGTGAVRSGPKDRSRCAGGIPTTDGDYQPVAYD